MKDKLKTITNIQVLQDVRELCKHLKTFDCFEVFCTLLFLIVHTLIFIFVFIFIRTRIFLSSSAVVAQSGGFSISFCFELLSVQCPLESFLSEINTF